MPTLLLAFKEKFEISLDSGVRSSSTGARTLFVFTTPAVNTEAGGSTLPVPAISDHAVSSVFIREENGQQKPIYYTSKIVLDAKTKYLQLEKLALALISASRKLSHYF